MPSADRSYCHQIDQQNLQSTLDIGNDIVDVDGGDDGNPPILPPNGVTLHCISVMEGKHLHSHDKIYPYCELIFTHVDEALPFISMPQGKSLNITRKNC